MGTFVARRLVAAAVLLFVVLTLTFYLVRLVPGDPSVFYADQRLAPGEQQALRRSLGLDRPLGEQYLDWLRALVVERTGGVSLSHDRPVRAVLAAHLGPTLLLAGTALAIQFGAGLLIGVAGARRPGSPLDHALRLGSLVLYSLPQFWLGLMALLALAYAAGLFPTGQMRSPAMAGAAASARFFDVLHHLALPALVLGLAAAGGTARFVRNKLLDELGRPHIRAARARGLAESAIVWRHALKNSLAPLVELLGLALPALLSGALVLEVVFSWPGMGRLAYEAVRARDYPLVLGTTALSATLVVTGTLLADILRAAVDPRLRRHDAG